MLMTSSIKPHVWGHRLAGSEASFKEIGWGTWVCKAWSRQSLLVSHHWGADHQQWLGVHQEVWTTCRRDLTKIGESESNTILCYIALMACSRKRKITWHKRYPGEIVQGIYVPNAKTYACTKGNRLTVFCQPSVHRGCLVSPGFSGENTWIWQDDELCLRQIPAASTWVEATCSMFHSF